MVESVHDRVTSIINQSNQQPNIVNEDSNFVVITYWWGRGRLNRNTARPCTSFYEDNLKNFNKTMLKLLNTAVIKDITDHGRDANTEGVMERIFNNLANNPLIFTTLIDDASKMVKHYINDICDFKGIDQRVADRFAVLRERFPDFLPELTNPTQLLVPVFDLMRDGIIKNKDNLIAMHNAQRDYDSLKAEYMKYKHNQELQIKNEEGRKKLEELNLLLFTTRDTHGVLQSQMHELATDLARLREGDVSTTGPVRNIAEFVGVITRLKSEKDDINLRFVATWKKKDSAGKSIFDKLIDVLEYKVPIMFEFMIENWENACREHGCNYLAIEYSEFAQEGGYQLAINAKPKFIEKAIQLCEGRSVLYIDGDMMIRQYPAIFDMKNIDFMARGWWIDPRASWRIPNTQLTLKQQENEDMSIMYDPYNFETSGGTMFFSSSMEAKKLIKLWIHSAESPTNDGKADDRVLSLIFNTKSVLLWIRTIQLPVEYLWLTIDYDERMMQEVYDYNKPEMESTIMIDHPECLTSEDTATGAGASSNRQPKFYDFLEDLYPCVETTHEYIIFKDLVSEFPETAEKITEFMFLSSVEKEQQQVVHAHKLSRIDTELADPLLTEDREIQLKTDREKIKKEKAEILYLPYLFWYYHYMGDVQYIDDGNADLIDLGFVDPKNLEDNAYPLNIVSYKDKFGNKRHPHGEGMSINAIVDINIDTAQDIDVESLYEANHEGILLVNKDGFTELIPTASASITSKTVIRIILQFLLNDKSIVFNPKSFAGYIPALYDKLVENLNTIYKNSDLVFHPQHIVSVRRSSFYKPKIDMNQVILFRPDSRLIDFLAMQLSLEDLSVFISAGSYEFMSLLRIAFIFKSKVKAEIPQVGLDITQIGGGKNQPLYNVSTTIREYSETFENPIKSLVRNFSNRAPRKSRRKRTDRRSTKQTKHKRKIII